MITRRPLKFLLDDLIVLTSSKGTMRLQVSDTASLQAVNISRNQQLLRRRVRKVGFGSFTIQLTQPEFAHLRNYFQILPVKCIWIPFHTTMLERLIATLYQLNNTQTTRFSSHDKPPVCRR